MNISETTRDTAIVTRPIERQQEVVCATSNGDIFNDLDVPLTRFQGHGIFEVEYLKNGASYRDKISIEQEIITSLSNGTTFNVLEWPLTRIPWDMTFLKSNMGKWCVLKQILLHNRKRYLTYGIVLCLVTLTDL